MTDISYFKPCLDYVYENMNINEISKKTNQTLKPVDETKTMELKDKIELKNIVYAYPNTDKLIFDNANMQIPYGKSVGIMGPSGAGKSTIVDILLGLLKVREGTIECDGVNIFDNYPAWLSQIGYIPQSIYLVDEPIRNNIAFGIADDEIDDNRIWEVLEEAQLKEFIETLPEGLDTAIGDRGVRLSGGQRQRIGIARALYHNPEILVFDEATSALDNETEAAVMEAINSFHGRKTMVIIAHRLNTIEKCDIIYKVDEGQIVETNL
jgi:ABC-type multidrug transport system fused ATPase/permease subunit